MKKTLDDHLQDFLNGDDAAFDIIYQETSKIVYISIKTIIRSGAIVEDLMQDTYMKAVASLSSYKAGTNFKAWIARIARNIALNEYNRRKREVISSPEDFNAVASPLPSLFHSLEIDHALKNLDDDEKEIFINHVLLDFKFDSIAKIMEIPLSTVYFKYKCALKKIKKELQ